MAGAPPPPLFGGGGGGGDNGGGGDRSDLLAAIRAGAKLKKTVTVDKSGPAIPGANAPAAPAGGPGPAPPGRPGPGAGRGMSLQEQLAMRLARRG
jgi:WAS/WASL-interacting protein